jgi:hypothetical protein
VNGAVADSTDDDADIFKAIDAALAKNNMSGVTVSKVGEGKYSLGEEFGVLTVGLLRGV